MLTIKTLLAIVLATTATPARAEVRAIPLSPPECHALAATLSRASGLALKVRNGPARSVDQNGPAGQACLIKGEGRRKRDRFPEVLTRVAAAPIAQGWRYDAASDADGPFEAFRLFQRGPERLTLHLQRDAPRGVCENVPVGDCRAPAALWTWTLKAAAYRQR